MMSGNSDSRSNLRVKEANEKESQKTGVQAGKAPQGRLGGLQAATPFISIAVRIELTRHQGRDSPAEKEA
jgi:hypothetical protein